MSNGDEDFQGRMIKVLHTSGRIQSPVLVRIWPAHTEVSLLSYTGIIVMQAGILEKYAEEDLSFAISGTLYEMNSGAENALLTQDILLCREASNELITAFCILHNLRSDQLINFESEICYWSFSAEYNNFPKKFKPSKKYQFYQ